MKAPRPKARGLYRGNSSCWRWEGAGGITPGLTKALGEPAASPKPSARDCRERPLLPQPRFPRSPGRINSEGLQCLCLIMHGTEAPAARCSRQPRGPGAAAAACGPEGRSGSPGAHRVAAAGSCVVVMEKPWGRGHLGALWGRQLWGGLGELSSPPRGAEQALGCGCGWVPAPGGNSAPCALWGLPFGAAVGALLPLSSTFLCFLFCFVFFPSCARKGWRQRARSPPCPLAPSCAATPAGTSRHTGSPAGTAYTQLLPTPGGAHMALIACGATTRPRHPSAAARSRQHPNHCHGWGGGAPCTPTPRAGRSPTLGASPWARAPRRGRGRGAASAAVLVLAGPCWWCREQGKLRCWPRAWR